MEERPSVEAVCTLKVEPVKVTAIKLKQTSISLGIGDEVKLVAEIIPENATNKEIIWSTSDRDIVTYHPTEWLKLFPWEELQ